MTKFYWHIHHDKLVEPLTEPLKNRIDYIQKNKPATERELCLRLLKPVRGKLPKEVVEAGKAWWEAGKARLEAYNARREAGKAWREAGKAWLEAYKAWLEALKKHLPAIETLHKKECKNCPWTGKTIFAT